MEERQSNGRGDLFLFGVMKGHSEWKEWSGSGDRLKEERRPRTSSNGRKKGKGLYRT